MFDTFLRLGMMDKRGSGMLRMRNWMKEWKLPQPEFKENTGYFVIKFVGPYQETVIEFKEKLNERQKIALNYITKRGPITNKEYQELCNVNRITATRDLTKLVDLKILIRKGTGKRNIRYNLNDAKNDAKKSD